jgi:hypothetical protein
MRYLPNFDFHLWNLINTEISAQLNQVLAKNGFKTPVKNQGSDFKSLVSDL